MKWGNIVDDEYSQPTSNPPFVIRGKDNHAVNHHEYWLMWHRRIQLCICILMYADAYIPLYVDFWRAARCEPRGSVGGADAAGETAAAASRASRTQRAQRTYFFWKSACVREEAQLRHLVWQRQSQGLGLKKKRKQDTKKHV